MISEESIIQRSEKLLESRVENEAVILGMESGLYIGLNQIGTEIWARLDHPVKVGRLIRDICTEFDADRITIKAEVLEFLNALSAKSLIVVVDEDQS